MAPHRVSKLDSVTLSVAGVVAKWLVGVGIGIHRTYPVNDRMGAIRVA